jgi:hypothetical protein
MLVLEREIWRRGWRSRRQFAAVCLVSPPRLGQILLGRIVPPTDGVELRRIATALGWDGDVAELLHEAEDAQ